MSELSAAETSIRSDTSVFGDRFSVVEPFARQALHSGTSAELPAGVDVCVCELGCRYWALVHRVDLRQCSWTMVHLDYAPEVGALHPVAALPRGSKPARKLDYQTRLCVDNAPELIRLTPNQRRILEKARRWGLGFGFAVPAHIPGGRTAPARLPQL